MLTPPVGAKPTGERTKRFQFRERSRPLFLDDAVAPA
jgi:hypothetical protein